MPCKKTFAFSQASLGEYALQDAVYVASTNKIYAVSGVYVVQLNASTGAVETAVRITSPVNNGARICYHAVNDTLYVTTWNDPSRQYYSLDQPNRDIRPVNPATMEVGPRLNVTSLSISGIEDYFGLGYFWGPMWIASQGNYLYFSWGRGGLGQGVARINPQNAADHCTETVNSKMLWEQAALTATKIFFPDPYNWGVSYISNAWMVDTALDTCDFIYPYAPIACEYCSFDGLIYVVDGNGNLWRINDETTSDITHFDLTTIIANADPCRLRWNVYDGLIYLPCMTTNSVMKFDPNTVTFEATATGFENPVDIVITPTKVWAVQNSPETPLKEIT